MLKLFQIEHQKFWAASFIEMVIIFILLRHNTYIVSAKTAAAADHRRKLASATKLLYMLPFTIVLTVKQNISIHSTNTDKDRHTIETAHVNIWLPVKDYMPMN